MPNKLCSTAAASRLVALADQCVMCGVCLPECPTYRIGNDEAESPRGRIALAKAIASGALVPTPAASLHLDQCLGCLSCQKACPSQVRYEDILVGARASQARDDSVLSGLLGDPRRLTRLARLGASLRSDRWLGPIARALLHKSSHARRIAETQPRAPQRLCMPKLRDANTPRHRIGLFQGCVASVYDRDTLAATRFLLRACGYDAVAPTATNCCGALARHRGDIDAAAATAEATRAAYAAFDIDHLLVSASGCFGDLRDEVLAGSKITTSDAATFFDTDAAFAKLRFRALRKKIALHLPCTQVNVVGTTAATGRLLARIPELEVVALPAQPRCCGAAGSYFLEHAAIADRLRDEKLDQAEALAPDLVLTSNIGCRLHLDNGLRARGSSVRVRHPLALLAEQLDTSTR